jgi:hypothetical protein
MMYSIYARSFQEAASLAREKGWDSNQYVSFLIEIDEPYARVLGAYDQTA